MTGTRGERDESGFLLVEVLVMSVLLLVALLALLPLYSAAQRQNAMAKDLTIGSSLALDKIEEFQQLPCRAVRRGTCCDLSDPPSPSLVAGACGSDVRDVGGITYERTCRIRQRLDDARYGDDSDASDHSFSVAGLAWIEVTVLPRRADHFATRSLKPAVASTWRVCEP